jgi:CBS domain-containing protein
MIWKVVAGDKDPNTTLVKDIMSKKVKTISVNKTLEEAAEIMVNSKIKKLPVIENKKLVGILTATDLISIQPKLIEALAKLMLFEEQEPVAG